MTKQISWDFAQVTQMLHFLVRQAGYHHNVSITYPVVGQHCWVYSPSLISRVSHDKCLQCLTCITCTWIVFVPLYYAFRQKASNKIVADYPCSISPQDFYLRNYWNSKFVLKSMRAYQNKISDISVPPLTLCSPTSYSKAVGRPNCCALTGLY